MFLCLKPLFRLNGVFLIKLKNFEKSFILNEIKIDLAKKLNLDESFLWTHLN